MVVICFPNGKDWFKANWAFRQLAADVMAAYPGDAELHERFLRAQAYNALFLDRMKPEEASRIMEILKAVAQDRLDGKIAGWLMEYREDPHRQPMYLESMSELLEAMSADPKRA
jgi:hypothetical protein